MEYPATRGARLGGLNTSANVGFFVTCVVDLLRPSVGFASIRLLENAGCRVNVPRSQACCGQPAYNSGDQWTAIKIAKQVIRIFEKFDYVVVPSGSCGGMIREHYPKLFVSDLKWLERARDLGSRTFELTQFLVDIMGVEKLEAVFEGSCTYHDSCSGLRELQIQEQPRKLLSSVNKLELKEMKEADSCCGFGGLFCVKYPEISSAMVSKKADNAACTGAATLLGGDLGCLLNIAGYLHRIGNPTRVFHVAEVLAGMAEGQAIGEPEDLT